MASSTDGGEQEGHCKELTLVVMKVGISESVENQLDIISLPLISSIESEKWLNLL